MILALAGCGTPEVVTTDNGAERLPASELVRWEVTDFFATEPTLGISDDGALFYAASGDANDPSIAPIFRSDDKGFTWKEVTPRLVTGERAPPYPVDPFLYLDVPTGRLFTINMHQTRDCAFLHWSDDKGESWTFNPHACGTPPPYDHQSLAAGRPRVLPTLGYEHVVYQCMNRISDSACARSLDGGWTWSPTAVPFFGIDPAGREGIEHPTICGGLHGHVVVAPDGTVILPKTQCGRPMAAVSQDDGLSWRVSVVGREAALMGPDPSVAADHDSNLYYVFQNLTGALVLTTSKDGGASWSKEITLTDPGMAAHFPAVAAVHPGRIVVQFLGTNDIPGGFQHPDMKILRGMRPETSPVNLALWDGFLVFIDEALSPAPIVRTFQANPAGDPLVRGDCDARYCATVIGDFQDVVATPHGKVFAAFVDHCIGGCVSSNATYRDNTGNSFGAPAALAVVERWPA